MIDTTNRFFVAIQGDRIRIMRPLPPVLTRDEALNLAAHLVAMADDGEQFDAALQFDAILQAVLNA